jgi:uncharacterized protein (DUF2062 family)
MWHFTKTAVRKFAEKLLHINDTPERTAAAFALGVTIGFSPPLGLHTVIGLGLAFALNLNRVAVLVGLYVHLPWFIGPYYAGTTALGAWLTGSHMPSDFLQQLEHTWHLPTWRGRLDAAMVLLKPLLPAYVLGSSIACLALGGIAYPTSLAFIRRRRHMVHPSDQPK